MFRRAWLRLWATPIFTIFAVVSLALGVGVTTAIYSVILSLTRHAMVVPDPTHVGVIVSTQDAGRRPTWRSVVSRADFDDLSKAGAMPGVPAASAPFVQSMIAPAFAELVPGEAVTGNYFQVLGLAPFRGRLIQTADDDPPVRVAVVSHLIWRARLAGDPRAVGKTIRIGGQPFEIVGVAPEGFGGLSVRFQAATAVWVPLSSTRLFPSGAAPPADPSDRSRRQLSVLMPLPPGTPVRAVSAEVAATGARLDAAFPLKAGRDPAVASTPMPRAWSVGTVAAVNRELDSQFQTTELAVMAVVGLVLVVACTNLANLVVARGSSRMHELAVRRALGASRTRLVVDQLAETSVLAGMGAIGAFGVARVLLVWFTAANVPISESMFVQIEPRLDAVTVIWAAVSLAASLVVFGLAPAVHLTRSQLRPSLAAEGGSTGLLRWRTRRTLIAVQVMISLSFFLIAAFALRAVEDEGTQPSGIDVDRLAMGTFNVGLPPWNETLARGAVDRLMTLIPGHPAFVSGAVMSGLPFGTTYTPAIELTTSDKPFGTGHADYEDAPLVAATPSVFDTLGVPILRGRGFDARDVAGATPVAVLSERTARNLFGSVDVVGRQCVFRSYVRSQAGIENVTVIGVAGDTDTQRRGSRRLGAVYVPLAQHFEPGLAFVGRTDGDPAELIEPMRALAQRADPDLVLDHPGTATLIVTGQSVLIGLVSRLAGGLAVLAMLLGMAGLSGVISHLVSRRMREMGLRMALGASPGRIRAMVLRDGFEPVLSGIIMGYLIALAVRMILRFADEFTLAEAIVFMVAPMPILAATFVACYWPATKASRVDPNVALKDL